MFSSCTFDNASYTICSVFKSVTVNWTRQQPGIDGLVGDTIPFSIFFTLTLNLIGWFSGIFISSIFPFAPSKTQIFSGAKSPPTLMLALKSLIV